MMLRKHSVVWLLIAILIVPGLVFAKYEGYEGRLIGKVVDPEGNVIAGVTVTATCKHIEQAAYKDVDTTDAKGMFSVDFPRLYRVYHLRFEKNGFSTLESEHEWSLKGKTRLQFTLYPGDNKVDGVPLASSSNDAIYEFNQAVAAYHSKDYPTAITRFQKALGHDAELHQAWAALAKIYVTEEQYQLAVEASEKAIELGSSDYTVWQSRYEAYRSLGDESKAEEALQDLYEVARKILSTDPTHEQAIRICYDAAMQTGNEAMIIDVLVSLAVVEPGIARDALLKRAFDAYAAAEMDDAKMKFGKVLEVDANHALSHYYLALIYFNEDANEEAKQQIQQFLELAPPDSPEYPAASQLLEYLESQ